MDGTERLRCYMYLKHMPLKIVGVVGSGFTHRHRLCEGRCCTAVVVPLLLLLLLQPLLLVTTAFFF